MGNVDTFLKSLMSFDKENIPIACVERASLCRVLKMLLFQLAVNMMAERRSTLQVEKDYMENPTFTPDSIRIKSGAAAGLCSWVINICKFFRIHQVNRMTAFGFWHHVAADLIS